MFEAILASLDTYWLVLSRVAGIFLVAPFFGARYTPVQVKVLLAVVTAALVAPVLPPTGLDLGEPWILLAAIVRESLVGLVIGFIAQLLFAAVQVAGQFVDLEMGFAMVNVFDPTFGQAVPLVGNFLYLVAMLLLLVLNGHHVILRALIDSFEAIPLGQATLGRSGYELIFTEFSWMFATAVRLAAPVWAALFVTSMGLAILARAVPQMNVFIVGLPGKVLIGVAGLMIGLPVFAAVFRLLLPHTYASMVQGIEFLMP